jgi:hypothetical protein
MPALFPEPLSVPELLVGLVAARVARLEATVSVMTAVIAAAVRGTWLSARLRSILAR